MKKSLAKRISLVVVSGPLLLLGALDAEGANLLINPSFGSGTDPWVLNGADTSWNYRRDSVGSCVRVAEDLMMNAGITCGSVAQTLPSSPNQDWTFSGWAYNPGFFGMHNSDYAVLEIIFRDASGASTVFQSPLMTDRNQDEWVQLTRTAIAPAGTTEVTFQASFYQNDTERTSAVYFDNFSAVSSVPEPYVGWLAAGVPVLAVLALKRQKRTVAPRAESHGD
jgi:hypothetical protein